MADEMLTKNFSRKELACPDCGLCDMKPDFLAKLQQLRESWNRPLILNSAFRCPSHNKIVGGAADSQHLVGNAVDIHCIDSFERFGLLVRALSIGFRGIGISKDFIHIDMRDGSAVCWVYPVSNSKA